MRKLYVIAIAIVSFFYACTKIESTTLGSGLIPTVDRVNTFDTTLEVTTANFSEENIPRVYKTNDHVIGAITNDLLFGTTTASAYFQLKPTSYPFYFPGKKADLIADSAVLILSYKGVFGDSTIPQTWNVFQINQSPEFKSDSSYPVTAKLGTGKLLASSINLDIRKFNDPIRYRFDSSINQIRIELDKSIANLFITQYDSSARDPLTNAYQNDSVFREKFAGFAIVPQGNGNALVQVNLADTNTKLSLYYSYKSTDASTTRDTTVANFRFSSGSSLIPVSAAANVVVRDRNSSAIAGYLNSTKSDEVFIQTSPGTFATIKIPGLSRFPNAIIHRAELIAEQDPDAVTDAWFSPPRFLLLSAYDTANKYKINIPNDFIYDPNSGPNIETFGGLLNNKSIPSVGITGSYTFNLTRYVQGIVSRKDSSYTLRLSAPVNDSLKYTPPYPFQSSGTNMLYISPTVANNIATGRVRLGGGSNTRVKMRLRVIYSKI